MSTGFPPSGSIFYRDSYSQLYSVDWETIDHNGIELLDFTTVIKTPFVWGQIDEGFIKDRQVFRRGICTTQRQIFAPNEDGYEIVAEGGSSVICIFQATFNCANAPTDPFRHHLDQAVCDEIEVVVLCGPRFADPSNIDDDNVSFSDVTAGGDIEDIVGDQPFQFVDVWLDSEVLVAVCEAGTEITEGEPSTLLDGLLSYWKFDEDDGIRVDETGNNDLIEDGNLDGVPGLLNNSVIFDPTEEDFLKVSHNGFQLSSATAASWSFWHKPGNLSPSDGPGYIISKGIVAGDNWNIYIDDNDITFNVRVTSNRDGSFTHSFLDTEWYSIIWIFDGSGVTNADRLKLYIDGVEQTLSFTGTIPTALPTISDEMNIGTFDIANLYLVGELDESGMWGRVLTTDEIAELYGGGVPPAYPWS